MSLHSRVDIIAAICKTDVSVKTTKAKHPNFSEPLQDNRPVVNMKNTASTADPTWNALATRRNGYFFLIFIASNVKEHATLSAGASVDHGVEVQTTQEHENRAADRGCVSRLVRLLLYAGLALVR